jgi:hypothetical protein
VAAGLGESTVPGQASEHDAFAALQSENVRSIEQVKANGIDRGMPASAEAADAGSLKTQENPQASGAVPIQAVR